MSPSETWRFIDAGRMEAPVAFGRMPVLAGAVAQGGSPVLMTSVWARAHFQIGWFDDAQMQRPLSRRRANLDQRG